MDNEKIRKKLVDFQKGNTSIDEVLDFLKVMPYDDIGFAQLDSHRALRTGLPEVVFCQNKTIDQVIQILENLTSSNDRILATRASEEMGEQVTARIAGSHFDPTSRLITINLSEKIPLKAKADYALVITAGTSDIPVAEEAAQTLEFYGERVERAFDVGVAGVHRLLDKMELLQNAGVIICIAGMEGALTSVVAGLVPNPVIGVPTSVGYGASFNGIAPLLAMLNSCAPGVAVVNIDNGFGAAQFAHLILNRG
jgi:hypothetical protein